MRPFSQVVKEWWGTRRKKKEQPTKAAAPNSVREWLDALKPDVWTCIYYKRWDSTIINGKLTKTPSGKLLVKESLFDKTYIALEDGTVLSDGGSLEEHWFI